MDVSLHMMRKTLYQSMLGGACGYTYGCNNIWQMYALAEAPNVMRVSGGMILWI